MHTKKTVLVADDCETFVMYMAHLLHRMGFNVIPADNGLEAVKLMKISKPDLVLLDINMPDLNGIETLEMLKSSESTCDIPVIMVTTEGGAESRFKCMEMGCAGYITKPIDIIELHDILQECLFLPLGFRRNYLRASCSLRAVVYKDGESIELMTETLSEGGAFIKTRTPFPTGTDLLVTIHLTDTLAISFDANVIYERNTIGDMTNPSGMAVKFNDVSDKNSAVLIDFIKRYVTQDILAMGSRDHIKIDSEAE